jgi:hypothetical protein
MFKKKLGLGRSNRWQAIAAIALLVIVGVYFLAGGHAATPYVTVAASSGTLNGATAGTCTDASNGHCVTFGSATSTTIASPTALQLNDASTTEAALTWTASATTGVTGYNVFRNGKLVGTTDSYTVNYLDSSLTPGTAYSYTVTAQVSSKISSPSSALSVTTGSSTTAINSCGKTLTSGGNYILTSNLSVTPTSNYQCLTASNANHFSLDCKGHTLTITGSNVVYIISGSSDSNFLITNCTIISAANSYYDAVSMSSLDNATFENDTFGTSYQTYENYTQLLLNNSSGIIFNNNTLYNAMYALAVSYSPGPTGTCSNNYIGNNTYTGETVSMQAAINMGSCSNDVIYKNTIDGGSSNGAVSTATEDGIIIGGQDSFWLENNDTIADNTIKNVWDAGIETLAQFNNTLVTHNTITNSYIAGIAAYWYTSWKNDTISDNTYTVTASQPGNYTNSWPQFFWAETETTASSPPTSPFYFENNNFISNTFNPSPLSTEHDGLRIDFGTPTQAEQNAIVGNNTFTDNDFSTGTYSYTPITLPQSLAVDGGANICDIRSDPYFQYTPPLDPFVCNP